MTIDFAFLPKVASERRDAVADVACTAGFVVHRLSEALLVTTSATPVLVSEQAACVVIGRTFRRGGEPLASWRTDEVEALVATNAGVALETLEGDYAVLWRDRVTGAWCAMRDPAGALPLLRLDAPGGPMLASGLIIAQTLGWRADGLDWTTLAHLFVFDQLPTRRTGLHGVTEVFPGERVGIVTGGIDTCWSPWAFVARGCVDEEETLARLRAAVLRGVEMATEGMSRILLELSGGLDSSVVAAALHQLGRPFRALNAYTATADGDERRFARLVAKAAGAPLAEIAIGEQDLDLLAPLTHLTPRPSGHGVLTSLNDRLAAAADCTGTDAVLGGAGGDQVFASIISPAPVIDALACVGWRAALGAAHDVARRSGSPIWPVIGSAFRLRHHRRQARPSWPADHHLLGADVRPTLRIHPWIERAHGALPGGIEHVGLILRAQSLAGTHKRGAMRPFRAPLLAQPVIEAALAIPSWRWNAGGRDRAAVRDTFAADLPDTVVRRRSKGRLESVIARAYTRQLPQIREALLDGLVARAGLLNLTALETALTGVPAVTDPSWPRILQLLDAELWARSHGGNPASA